MPEESLRSAALHSDSNGTPTIYKGALKVVNPLECADWDTLVAAHPAATLFHSSVWARVLHDTYGHQPLYLVAVKDGRLFGALPVMEVGGVLGRKRVVSLPFTDYCAPLVLEHLSTKDLILAGIQFFKGRNLKHFECRGVPPDIDGIRPSLGFYTHLLDLRGTEQEVLARVKSRVRTRLRRAQEAGLSVSFETSETAVREFYELHCLTRRKHGVPPQPYRFFENIQRQILSKSLGWVVVARSQGHPAAANIFFHHGKQAIYKFGASDVRPSHLDGSLFVMWQAIRRYCNEGLHFLDFGRTSLGNDGLRQFKRGFGSEERHVAYCKFDYRDNDFVADKDRAEGWHNHLFCRTPIPLLRLAGSLLYPHLS